jgi:hypothetical protein
LHGKKNAIGSIYNHPYSTYDCRATWPVSGILSFRVFNNGKMVDLNSNGWKVSPAIDDKFFKSISYTYPGYYSIKPRPSPGGAVLNRDFHVEIIHLKDTMKLFMPSIDYKEVKIDSIPFASGIYHIPQHIYNVKPLMAYYKTCAFTPNLNGDWSLFSKEVYQCYLEKVQDVQMDYLPHDYFHNYTKLELMNNLNYHNKAKSNNYYYLENAIIYSDNDRDYKIYRVREISDTTFWGSKIEETKICFLYAQNNQVYAVASRDFGSYTGRITEFGIYKLHFYDAPIDATQRRKLKTLLDKETYQSVLKTKSLNNEDNNSLFLPGVTRLYNKLALKR